MKNKFNYVFWILFFCVFMHQSYAADKSSLDLTLLSYSPAPASPGETIEVWIQIENLGTDKADSVALTMVENNVFTNYEKEDIKTYGILNQGRSVVAKFNIIVNSDASKGTNYLKIKYCSDYSSATGEASWVEENVEIDIQIHAPALVISEIKTDPERTRPGNEGELCIKIENKGSDLIRDLKVKLSVGSLTSFIPLSSTQHIIPALRPNSVTRECFDFMIDPETEAGTYRLPINMTFYDEEGTSINFDDYATIIVSSEPSIIISTDEAEYTDGAVETSVIISNNGLEPVKYMTVEITSAEGAEIISPKEKEYLGNIDIDDDATFTIKLKPLKKEANITIKMDYLNALNEEYSEEKTVIIEIPPRQRSYGGIIFWLIVIGVAIFMWRKKHRLKK
ncbi:COG1361 S-layer family protein [Candidatus Woesearchaeota archaeon]|nr:COG1361 S-layer family protein [Candidatus Woesearchaeota archaeon]